MPFLSRRRLFCEDGNPFGFAISPNRGDLPLSLCDTSPAGRSPYDTVYYASLLFSIYWKPFGGTKAPPYGVF